MPDGAIAGKPVTALVGFRFFWRGICGDTELLRRCSAHLCWPRGSSTNATSVISRSEARRLRIGWSSDVCSSDLWVPFLLEGNMWGYRIASAVLCSLVLAKGQFDKRDFRYI